MEHVPHKHGVLKKKKSKVSKKLKNVLRNVLQEDTDRSLINDLMISSLQRSAKREKPPLDVEAKKLSNFVSQTSNISDNKRKALKKKTKNSHENCVIEQRINDNGTNKFDKQCDIESRFICDGSSDLERNLCFKSMKEQGEFPVSVTVHSSGDRGKKKSKDKNKTVSLIIKSFETEGTVKESNFPRPRKSKHQKKLKKVEDSISRVEYSRVIMEETEEIENNKRLNVGDEQRQKVDVNQVSTLKVKSKILTKKRKRSLENEKEIRKKNVQNSTNNAQRKLLVKKSDIANGKKKKKSKNPERKAGVHNSTENQILDITNEYDENTVKSMTNPLCVEMRKKDYVPSILFNHCVSDFNSQSSDLSVSGDHNLNWCKLMNISKARTEKCEIQVGEVNSTSCEQHPENGNDSDIQDNISPSELNCHALGHKFIPVSINQMILALPPGHTLYLKGILKFKILVGCLEVLGYEMNDKKDETQTVCSPYGYSFLSIQHLNDIKCTKQRYWHLVQRVGKQYLNNNPAISELSEDNLMDFTSLILLESVSNSLTSFLLRYYPNSFFPVLSTKLKPDNPVAMCLKAEFPNPKTNFKRININDEWNVITKQLMSYNPGSLRFIPFGAKGVGKSTFLRFIINRMLSATKKVLYIDLDPGQCEFTFPGCVSAVVVDKPLLGPNIAHLTEPVRSVYVGEIEVSKSLIMYMQSVKCIFDWCSSQEHLAGIPWFINTMGFSTGVGVDLAIYTINLFNPSHVVQIYSASFRNNFPFRLEPTKVKEAKTNVTFDVNEDLDYSFSYFQSCAEKPEGGKSLGALPANLLREFTVVAYFSSVVSPPTYSLLRVVPYVIPFSRIKLCVCNENISYCDYLNAMNANTVALCNVGHGKGLVPSLPGFPEIWDKQPLGSCYGMGIVRGVDMEQKVIFLISPIKRGQFKHVNCLVLGSVRIPSTMFINQEAAVGEIPYVMEGVQLPLFKNVKVNKAK